MIFKLETEINALKKGIIIKGTSAWFEDGKASTTAYQTNVLKKGIKAQKGILLKT